MRQWQHRLAAVALAAAKIGDVFDVSDVSDVLDGFSIVWNLFLEVLDDRESAFFVASVCFRQVITS